ncbi:protein kinase [Streptomyces sp. NPDC006365]|uniref:protein kinase domain-containing protein n=1 Tax=Streptomyces sp. NPDC006365 TaxID=3364744 RepID=UPI00369C86CB
MSEQRPAPPDSPTNEAAALRESGATPLRPGDPGRVGPYVPLGMLGSGGMGRVYLARPADGGPGLVAVKVIRPEYAEDAQFRRRFKHEASVHARVRTPRTPRLCGTDFQDELLWIATEYVPGLDLADAIREDGALETATVWRLVKELGQALADLAAGGIVHRDLKPSNVLLSVRGAHVIDFGLSKAADASAITGTGNRVGTPAYMSPEHLRTGRCDTASDVFSLAGTLVYAATGRGPFGDGTGVDVMHRVAFEEPNPELMAKVSAADAALGSLLSICLAKEPERRPTPQDLIDAAAGALSGTSTWREPLLGKVLARQRAYEALHRLPVEQTTRLRSSDDRPAAEPRPSSEPVPQPSQPGSGPPVQAPAPLDVTPPGQSRPAGARPWARRKPVLAVAAGITLCAVAAGVFMLTRQDSDPNASSPGAGATASVGTVPGDADVSPVPGVSDGTSAPAASGNDASGNGANGLGGVDASRPEVSGTADDSQRNDPSAPGTETSGPADASPSQSSPSSELATPPWISDCTHYSGNGRTSQGDSGKRVQQVQCMLTKRGYSVGNTGVDGDFGPGTESAVRSFQSGKELAADGVVGRETWVALRSTE